MGALRRIAKRVLFNLRLRPPPRWMPSDPNGGGWAELLSVEPTIIHTWPSVGFPLGAAGTIGPIFRRRRIHFLVMPSWSLEIGESARLIARVAETYRADHPRHEVTFLGNTERETELLRAAGERAVTINQNCLMDDTEFRPLPGVEPIHNAVYNARLSPEKRTELAREIEKLALIYFYNAFEGSPAAFHAEHARFVAMMPTARFVNELTAQGCRMLGARQVNEVLAQSRVGLCLSPVEGPMRASIEYLFAGLSVVSTPSLGGRDAYFDDEYCTIADPDPRSIREAVAVLVARNVPREYVRAKTMARVERDRGRYIAFVQDLIDRGGGDATFVDRFWECTHGHLILHWRSMKEFKETVRRELRSSRQRPGAV